MTLLTFRPIRIATGSEDEDGCLVFNEDHLIAVLVRLSDLHGDAEGKWFLEAAFGHLHGGAGRRQELDWISNRGLILDIRRCRCGEMAFCLPVLLDQPQHRGGLAAKLTVHRAARMEVAA